MSFASKIWRLLVGIKDALVLIFMLLFFGLLFGALSSRPSPANVTEGALLLALNGSIVEEAAAIDPLNALISGTLPTGQYEARHLVRAIDEAAKDERINSIALDLTTFTGGSPVNMKEVADALGRFRRSDKPIVAYAVAYADDSVMLASQATEVWVDPLGGAAIRGPGGTILFYGDALERFDINAHVYQVGTYKGTGDPYMRGDMSPELRENLETYIGQIWEEYQAYVVQARPGADIDAATAGLSALLEEHNGDLAEIAIATGLADTIGTYDEWGARIAEIAGEDRFDDLPSAFAHTELGTWQASLPAEESNGRTFGGSDGSTIGVITVAGEISDGQAGPGNAGAARITAMLDDALEDDLAGLVIRVDSPGGTVTGSETIRRAVMRHRDKGIPVAISMGNYAASGGYWIATAGQRIFAEPETITGSIGVVAVVPSFEDVLSEYSINAEQVLTTPLSGQPDILGGFSPEVEELLQAETAHIYERFLALVADARGLTRDQADELAQGRVWTGGTARQLGLIDQFGDLDAALTWVASEAGLEEDDWDTRFLTSPVDPFDAMIGDLMSGSAKQAPQQSLVTISGQFALQESQLLGRLGSDLDRLFSNPGIHAMCMECMPHRSHMSGTARAGSLSWWQSLALRSVIN